ncbi:hypothetical protein GCM10017744_083020 [Streptomyces antimycoticus]|uniref:Uncharacterized protein n=1 Tax=Streptomyces antimycoticus TaxID=68175 RepID=A0A4D4JW38_9ACTN|nr:hypothetical protein [Streptomyces antimycoticus]GDY40951.1 hypothetical protein SANT12839_018330 [Streptomyces antimycoticus]
MGNLRLWDVRTHQRIRAPLTSALVVFQSAAISPDGDTLITGGADRAQFWQLPSLRQSGRSLGLSDHTLRPFEVVALSPDGRTLATGGNDGEDLWLWDVASRRQRGEVLTGHEGGVDGLLFSPDGRTLAVSSHIGDGVVRLWDVASRRRRGEALTGHQGGVGAMVFSPDGTTLAVSASVGADGLVRLFDTATGTQRGEPLRARTVVSARWPTAGTARPSSRSASTAGSSCASGTRPRIRNARIPWSSPACPSPRPSRRMV